MLSQKKKLASAAPLQQKGSSHRSSHRGSGIGSAPHELQEALAACGSYACAQPGALPVLPRVLKHGRPRLSEGKCAKCAWHATRSANFSLVVAPAAPLVEMGQAAPLVETSGLRQKVAASAQGASTNTSQTMSSTGDAGLPCCRRQTRVDDAPSVSTRTSKTEVRESCSHRISLCLKPCKSCPPQEAASAAQLPAGGAAALV